MAAEIHEHASILHDASFTALLQRFLRITRNQGLSSALTVIRQLLCCARRILHQSLLETAQYTEISKGPS